MKPAISVIFFTVGSGAGLGLMIWLVLGRWCNVAMDPRAFWIGVATAALLLTAGLLSSTLHLANPRNAWRALSRFRSSWLSREGVFAMLVYPLAALYLYSLLGGRAVLERLSGVALIALALAVLASTAMIYACLKTVPRWRNWQTIVAYPLYGLASGGVLWLALRGADGRAAGAGPAGEATAGGLDAWLVAVVLLLLAGALLKLHYWRRFSALGRQSPTIDSALNLRGNVRLLDVGHTHATFLTDEFGFVLARRRARTLRFVALVLAFAVPGALLLALPDAAALAALCCLAGLLVERWLFFAEAQHVVRLYHGQRRI